MTSIWRTTRREAFTLRPLKGRITTNVLIVGSGISGLSAALALSERGIQVALVDAGEQVGAGTSGATSAHLTTVQDEGMKTLEDRFGEEKVRAIVSATSRAIDTIEQWVERYDIACNFERCEGYYYTESERDAGQISEEADACERAGIEVEREVANPLPFEVAAMFAVKNQAKFQPLDYIDGLARAAQKKGAKLFGQARVTAIETNDQGQFEACINDSFAVTAERVIMATHTPVGRHLAHAALPPYRSYMVAVTLNDRTPSGLFWDNQDPYHYTRDYEAPDGQHYLLIGGADHKTGDGDAPQSAQDLRDYVEARYDVAEIAQAWNAQWYQPSDGLPMYGKSPAQSSLNEDVITGLGGDGLTRGTYGALTLADAIEGGSGELNAHFELDRLSLGLTAEFLKANAAVARNLVLDRAVPKPSLEAIAPGSGGIIRQGLKHVAVWREEDGSVCAFGATCPHMKGLLQYNEQEKTFDCPCHGQRFTHHGQPIEGPSPHALKPVELSAPSEG